MFNFLRKKTPFETYYSKFTSIPAIKGSIHYKAFTSAYLFVVSDLMYSANYSKRRENADRIFDFVEHKDISKDELPIFDMSVDLFGRVMRGEISPRGEWCLYDGKSENGIYRLYLCYGDLINNPSYINDYVSEPILIRGIDEQYKFAIEFKKIWQMTVEYMDMIHGRGDL